MSEKVTIPKPFDNRIVPDKTAGSRAGRRFTQNVRIMKESTTEYYNMRTAPGLECA